MSAGDKPKRPSDEDMKKMQDVGTKYGECMATAMGGGGGTTGSSDTAKPADPPKPAEPVAAAGGESGYKSPENNFCMTLPATFKSFWSWNDHDGNCVTVLTHKDLSRIFCRTHDKPKADAAMVEACKSIRPM